MVKTMSMKVKERLLMAGFFPSKGSTRDMRITKDIARKVRLSDEERAEKELVQDKDGIRWSPTKDEPVDIEFNDDEREFLKRQVRRLDEEAAFDMDLYDLAERIKEL